MSVIEDIAASVQDLTETLRLAAADPADQIRLLINLAQYGLTANQTQGPIVSASPTAKAKHTAITATSALCRRAALASLATAVSLYTPVSSSEAQDMLHRLLPLYDREIQIAGDLGDDTAYSALRDLRTAVSNDLQSRAINLPEVIAITRAAPLPSLVIAYSLYEDADRAEELAQRVDTPHPLMMPTTFSALSS
ncbi:hypothetical protein [Paracraurococcus lichenis]|uniref:Uncharacterized protein n=1 Tax=Paracraurococcus lichenis TaxID=3064888 RepID=A0ABT9E4E6_9PROT|nr:hypothetical protein [Paracraurococcus sp. LOR1-02]MDO9711047.1 hypothetical protein [Paracraurococcus sp. LOR1-02]